MDIANSTFLVTGGTGSFGKTMVQRLIESDVSKIVVFSRDEEKQDHMRHQIRDDRLVYEIGDVLDYESIKAATKGVDYIFHAAALKQVPSCEFYPDEAVKTNILGTNNVINAALDSKIKGAVLLSTDKAVYPINAMGISKAMAEKLFLAAARKYQNNRNIKFLITRYGNVMGSRGSVIPLFIKQIKNNENITITNENMTRFLMTLPESVELVLHAIQHGNTGDLFIKKAPASTIRTLANSLMQGLNKDVNVEIIGERHGEKLYETLVSKEENSKADDMGDYLRIPADLRPLKYTEGEKNVGYSEFDEYNSHNTVRLNVNDTLQLLKTAGFIPN